jgi:hypothetical protein
VVTWRFGKETGREKPTVKKKDKEEVELTVRANEKEKEGKAEKEEEGKTEKEEEGKAEKREWLCIPKTMRRQILHEAHDTPAGGDCGVD